MEMNNKEKIFKICLITLVTLIGVDAMLCLALSAEPAIIPTAGPSLETSAAGPEAGPVLNEIGIYFDSMEKLENGDFSLPAQTGTETESSEYSSNITRTVRKELIPYRGWILWIEPTIFEDFESPEFAPAIEPKRPTPEVIEISSNQNKKLNYVKVIWYNQGNELDGEEDSLYQ